MMTKTVEFREVDGGDTFSAAYGEHGQCRTTFRKVSHNMGRCLDGDWPMPFLYDEKVEIEADTLGVTVEGQCQKCGAWKSQCSCGPNTASDLSRR